MLRNDIYFKVYAGYREINLSTKPEIMREKTFNRILVNEKETSLTIEMGNNEWSNWSIIREIYCNALDEGEASVSMFNVDSEKDLLPIEDYTTFYIKVNDEFEKILSDWNLYFSEKRKDIVYSDLKGNKIFSGNKELVVYRKGIRCHYEDNQKSIFHYDFDKIEINESRVLKSDFSFRNFDLPNFFKELKDVGIIESLLYSINDSFERTISWNTAFGKNFSDEWLEAINNRYLVPYENAGFWTDEVKLLKNKIIILPNNLIEGLKSSFGDKIKLIGETEGINNADKKVIENLTDKQKYLLDFCLDFLKKVKYEVKYPVKVVKFFNSHLLGQAENETIFISEKNFTMGKKEIINTIIEENEHLVTGHKDETRAFQTHLINLIIEAWEDKINEYL